MNLKDGIEQLRFFFLKKREFVGEPERVPSQERRHSVRRHQDLLLKGVEEETVAALVEMSIQLLEEQDQRAEISYPPARRRQYRRRKDQVLCLLKQELGDPAFLGVIEELIRLHRTGDRDTVEGIQRMLQARAEEC